MTGKARTTSAPGLTRRVAGRLKRLVSGVAANTSPPKLATGFSADEQRLLELLLKFRNLSGGQNKQKRDEIEQIIERDFYKGAPWFDPQARAESQEPLLFCISYPRSGTTRFLHELRNKTNGHIFLAKRPERLGLNFDKRWQPRSYPHARLIKDHRPLGDYLHDDGYLIVRDGRDCMVSLAWMTRSEGLHQFYRQDELKDFIAWTVNKYGFGCWADHTRRLMALKAGGHKTIVRYEDQSSDKSVHEQMAAKKDEARKAWGLVTEDLTGSMFEAWQNSRGKSNWHQSFDREAAKAFHATGATEMLIELGYETDPNWWKNV